MQNHLMQILALVAMEQPLSFSAAHIRQEKVKALQSVLPLRASDIVVGQYDGYTDDPTITNKASSTETYAWQVASQWLHTDPSPVRVCVRPK